MLKIRFVEQIFPFQLFIPIFAQNHTDSIFNFFAFQH